MKIDICLDLTLNGEGRWRSGARLEYAHWQEHAPGHCRDAIFRSKTHKITVP